MSATDPILQVAGLGKRFGGFVALADIELEVARGERPDLHSAGISLGAVHSPFTIDEG